VAESDDLYSKILREMYKPAWLRMSGRQTNATLAKMLGVDEETVRSIVVKMRKSGFLKSWTVSLNPHALGVECESILVKLSDPSIPTRERVKSQLRLIEGVVAIFSFLNDPLLRIVLYNEDEEDLERKIRLISSICGSKKPELVWNIPFPALTHELKKTDWLIIRSLFKNSKQNVSEIAANIGVSTRTIARRLDFMMEQRAFFLSPIVDAKKVDGFLYHFIISFGSSNRKQAADSILRQSVSRIVFTDTSATSYSIIATICQNISEAQEISDLMKKTDGVESVIATVFEDIDFVHDWIYREIERKIKS
jgi:DNA-binding Lrp family transcriptional regulator